MRNGKMIFRPLKKISGLFADTAYSKAYLRHLIHSGEILGAMIATLHNLPFLPVAGGRSP